MVINGIAGLFPECKPKIIDIREYKYDWSKLRPQVEQVVMPLQNFIKQDDKVYDVVMMLNSYRNWRKKSKNAPHRANSRNEFDEWLINHCKYFITSGTDIPYEQGEIRGHDYRNMLQLFKMPLSYVSK